MPETTSTAVFANFSKKVKNMKPLHGVGQPPIRDIN